MKIINHPSCTDSLGAPSDMQDGSCSALPVRYEKTEHGMFAVSYWLPEAAELAAIMAGGGVELWVRAPGRQHPVVAVGTFDSIGTFEPAASLDAGIEMIRGVVEKVLAGAGPMENRNHTRDMLVAALVEVLQ